MSKTGEPIWDEMQRLRIRMEALEVKLAVLESAAPSDPYAALRGANGLIDHQKWERFMREADVGSPCLPLPPSCS